MQQERVPMSSSQEFLRESINSKINNRWSIETRLVLSPRQLLLIPRRLSISFLTLELSTINVLTRKTRIEEVEMA